MLNDGPYTSPAQPRVKKERAKLQPITSDLCDGSSMPSMLRAVIQRSERRVKDPFRTEAEYDQDEKDRNDGKTVAKRSDTETQVPDPYTPFYSGIADEDQTAGGPIMLEPPLNPYDLMTIPTISSALGPAIDAMVANVDLTGYSLEYTGKEGSQNRPAVQAEKERIEGLLEFPNGDATILMLREQLRRDYETLGWCGLEVVRDKPGGEITSIHYVPGFSLRLTTKDRAETVVNSWRWVGDSPKKFTYRKRFRRHVQWIGFKQRVWFKEFGDPRPIKHIDGTVAKDSAKISDLANELWYYSQFSPGEAYALPRWLPQITAILGTREAEITNLGFFQGNAIPAMAILVSGGYLTDETMRNLQNQFRANKGRNSMNKVLIIEAQVSDDDRDLADGAPDVPKLDFKALSHDRQQDALFMDYDIRNAMKIRSAFRLPPIFIGLTDDYTRATAQSSIEVAESQVFVPERAKFDSFFNNTILQYDGKPPRWWKMVSNTVKIVGADEVTQALIRLEKVGAVTPNVGIKLAKNFFNIDLEEVDKPWGDMPFEFSKALLANGNMDLEGNFLKTSIKAAKTAPSAKPGTPKPGTPGASGTAQSAAKKEDSAEQE